MENRFEVVKYEKVPLARLPLEVFILRDKQTGVMYLANNWGNAGGLTPLLDKDGKPMIDLENKHA